MQADPPFKSFFLGGFECASHRRADGRRLDLLASTQHDRLAGQDYAQLARLGISSFRDGLRWHRIERLPYHYDWSTFLPMLRAARDTNVQVIWDLCHYGWPDGLDIWSPSFVDRFAAFAGAVATVIKAETDETPFFCPVNEISFWAWAGGEIGSINPRASRRGAELKRQLVRASLAAIDRIRAVDPSARFITAEPLINVVSHSTNVQELFDAEAYRRAQYEAADMLAGRREPELGGREDCLDIVGVNYYPHNQWIFNGPPIPFGTHSYRALSSMLEEVHARYGRPLLLAETGAEGGARASWIHYVLGEAQIALQRGVPLAGICLYPVLDYPGWENDRLCEVGLLGPPGDDGKRAVCNRVLEELMRFSKEPVQADS